MEMRDSLIGGRMRMDAEGTAQAQAQGVPAAPPPQAPARQPFASASSAGSVARRVGRAVSMMFSRGDELRPCPAPRCRHTHTLRHTCDTHLVMVMHAEPEVCQLWGDFEQSSAFGQEKQRLVQARESPAHGVDIVVLQTAVPVRSARTPATPAVEISVTIVFAIVAGV